MSRREIWMDLGARRVVGERPKLIDRQTRKPLNDDGYAVAYQAAEAWARCGFPQVVVPHKLAASLMATSMPDTEIGGVEMPWPTFCVLVPSGLCPTGSDSRGDIDFVLLSKNEAGEYTLCLFNVAGHSVFFRMAPSLIALSGSAFVLIPRKNETLNDEDADKWSRLSALLTRLCIGAIIEIDSKNCVSSPGGPSRRTDKNPVAWTWRLTRAVKLDVRQPVISYARGDGTRPKVQSLVRGHWKPNLSKRLGRLIHVEPYWRGPEDAPIAVRHHVLPEAQ